MKRLALATAFMWAANLTIPGGASALRDDVFTSVTQPANTLLVPFDVTDGHETYIQVSNPHGTSSSSAPKITTHWAFWSDSCDHLLDVSICLTLEDTVVVDPRKVSAQNQANEAIGPVGDLSGERGFVTVTAYATDEECGAPDVLGFKLVDNAIVGLVTLANDSTSAAVGFDAIGLGLDPSGTFVDLPDQLLSPDAGDGFLDIQTPPDPRPRGRAGDLPRGRRELREARGRDRPDRQDRDRVGEPSSTRSRSRSRFRTSASGAPASRPCTRTATILSSRRPSPSTLGDLPADQHLRGLHARGRR